jgi:hypothetical protein
MQAVENEVAEYIENLKNLKDESNMKISHSQWMPSRKNNSNRPWRNFN